MNILKMQVSFNLPDEPGHVAGSPHSLPSFRFRSLSPLHRVGPSQASKPHARAFALHVPSHCTC